MTQFNEEYCIRQFEELLKIDSTTGQYEEIQAYLCSVLQQLGVPYQVTHKGGVIAILGSHDSQPHTLPGNTSPQTDQGNFPASAESSGAIPTKSAVPENGALANGAIAVTAHLDDIGLMVRHINADGTLNVCPVGGLYPFYCMGENVRVHTRDNKVYTGTVCRTPNSIHVTEEELREVASDFRKNVCIVLDEDVASAEDTKGLGIATGDMIALEPRFTRSGGYLKSHFVDDKACAAVLLAWIKAVTESKCTLKRKVYAYFAMYEEIGHGTSWLPADVQDMLAIDIAPTGPEQNSDEHKVSIFAKDSRFPYHWGMTNELRQAAISAGVDFVMDIFTPHYGTDCDVSIVAGYDIRHAAIGPGTANSHGYERTHVDGLRNTYDLLAAYLEE